MANQAYNGQPINIQFDYEGEGTMDSKLVQLSETAAKDPTTWLKNGIYRIGNGQPVFTQDGKLLLYIGRNGNATDIADDTKWIKFTSTADVQAMIGNGISASMQPFHIVDTDISATPTDNVEAGNAYIVGTSFTIAESDILTGVARTTEVGDILIAVDVEEETEDNGETVTNTVTKFAVMQTNIDFDELRLRFLVPGGNFSPSGVYNPVLSGVESGGQKVAVPSSVLGMFELENFYKDYKGIGTAPARALSSSQDKNSLAALLHQWDGSTLDWGDFEKSRYTVRKHFLDDFEKVHMLAMVDSGIRVGTDEDAFITAVLALERNHSYSSPLEFVMTFHPEANSESLAANFFGFTKSMLCVRGVWEKGRAYGSKGVIHFKNYDLAGTLSNPCVEYTYDMDTKVLSYQKFIEVTVSNS